MVLSRVLAVPLMLLTGFFHLVMRIIATPSVWIVERLRSRFRCQTWMIENICVGVILVMTVILTGNHWMEWIGAFAVFRTFEHANIANRMEETQRKKVFEGGTPEVRCYHKLEKVFVQKETAWMVYFSLIGAYSALVGVFVFLLYYPWREAWRKAHPV